MKKVSSLLLAAALCLSLVSAASAAERRPDCVSFGSPPYSYDVWSSLYTDGTQFRAAAWVHMTGGAPAPAGYMGANMRLYSNDQGLLLSATGWRYNSAGESFLFPVLRSVSGDPGQFSICGEAKLYAADMYARLRVPGGPSQRPSDYSEALLATLDDSRRYPVNTHGHTYGSALLSGVVGCEPDLIAARGTDGVCGYVTVHDLTPDLLTPEEAVAYMAEPGDRRVLPLYDVNETVIGAFVLEPGADPGSGEWKGCDLAAAQAKVERGAYTQLPAAAQLPRSPEELAALAARSRACYYPENSAGQTYGSSAVAGSVGHKPDLIAVLATNGEKGYVLKEDLNGPVIHTPEEAAAYMDSPASKPTLLPVYDLEGRKIGQFQRG